MLYSIIVPVYNSSESLEVLFEEIQSVFNSLKSDFEVVFIEDNSKDTSWKIICKLKECYPEKIKAVKLSKNFGQHNAIMCGLHLADGDVLITIDDDLQTHPKEIPKLINEYKKTKSELIYGIYQTKQHNLIRNFGSFVIQKIFKIIFNNKKNITSFRLFTKDLCSRIKIHTQSFVFADGLLHWHTRNISYVTVEHQERKSGSSNYNMVKLLLLSSNLFLNFSLLPLRIIIFFGLAVSLMSFSMVIYFIIRKFIYDVPLGYTSVIVSLFFIGGALMLILGIIGEYVVRIFTLQNNKPQFSIEKKLL